MEINTYVKDLIKLAIAEDIGDGDHTRSFCYVSDHIRLVTKLAEKANNEIVNVGNDREVKIRDLAEKIHILEDKEFNPKYLSGREYDHKRRCPDISKLRKIIDDQPNITLEKGLKLTINDYKEEKIEL